MSYLLKLQIRDLQSPVPNASIGIRRGSEFYQQLTNLDGEAEFSVDAGEWTITVYKTGYQPVQETRTIGADTTIELVLVSLLPPPLQPGFVTCYARCIDSTGNPVADPIFYKLTWLAPQGFLVHPDVLKATPDPDGLLTVQLLKGGRYLISRDMNSWIGITIPIDAEDQFLIPSLVLD